MMDEGEKLRKEKRAGFFLDMAKLSFAGMVVGCLMSITDNSTTALVIAKSVVGAVLTLVFARIGFLILK